MIFMSPKDELALGEKSYKKLYLKQKVITGTKMLIELKILV